MNGCKRDPCKDTVCLNGGYCVDGTCSCPDGFTGPNCETDIRPDCQKFNTGTINFDNWSSNPYYCYVDGVFKGTVEGYGNLYVEITPGYCLLKTVQESGYVLYPSEFTGNGTITQCGTLTFKFP
jgi:hypothetical protein